MTGGSVAPIALHARREIGIVRAILVGGFVAGTLDIGAACLIYKTSPVTILHAIAAGLLGEKAFAMGSRAALLGLALQWGMSWIIAGIYAGARILAPVLFRRWVWAGCAYGIAVFLVMNYVVVPLSAIGEAPHFTVYKAIANLLAMLWFGLVIAYFSRGIRRVRATPT